VNEALTRRWSEDVVRIGEGCRSNAFAGKARLPRVSQRMHRRSLEAPFPLTPALSLGEREDHFQRFEGSDAPGMIERRATCLPLPKGEGRGEGEERIRPLAAKALKPSPLSEPLPTRSRARPHGMMLWHGAGARGAGRRTTNVLTKQVVAGSLPVAMCCFSAARSVGADGKDLPHITTKRTMACGT